MQTASKTFTLDLTHRLRRLRTEGSMRAMVQETWLRASDFIQPLFIKSGSESERIESLPGQYRHTLKSVVQEAASLSELGIRSVGLFPYIDPALKDTEGQEALNPNSIIYEAIREIKEHCPELTILVDIALDAYTTHAHDGVLDPAGTYVDNDRSVEILTQMSLIAAEAGADIIAPSDMMDGRIGAIRKALDASGHTKVAIMSYAAKYLSGYYGPYRDAIGSAQAAGTHFLDKATYQLSPPNRRQAIREAAEDEREGADFLMVKPAGLCLDIIRDFRENTHLPIAAYQISGEYAQIHAGAEKGWLCLERCREESLMAIKRAGADVILTYFAKDMAIQLAQS